MHLPVWSVLPDSTMAPQQILDQFRSRSLAGMGDFCDDYPADCGQVVTETPTPSFPTPVSCTCINGTCLEDGNSCSSPAGSGSSPVLVAPSQSSAAWASFAAQLAKSGMTLAAINSIQPGTVVGKDGSILRQAPGFAVPTTTSNLNLGVSGISSNTLMVMGLAAVVLLLVVKK